MTAAKPLSDAQIINMRKLASANVSWLAAKPYIEMLFATIDDLKRQIAEMEWQLKENAPDEVATLAKLMEPKLGQACTRAAMGHKGNRYAFIFDNPTSNKYVWMPLPEPPK